MIGNWHLSSMSSPARKGAFNSRRFGNAAPALPMVSKSAMYILENKQEIIFRLRRIIMTNGQLELELPNNGKIVEAMLSEVSERDFLFSPKGGNAIGIALLACGRARFRFNRFGSLVQFQASGFHITSHLGHYAIRANMPERLFEIARNARREHTRASLGKMQTCSVTITTPKNSWKANVLDVGEGGLSLSIVTPVRPFKVGDIIRNASFHLDKYMNAMLDLRVCSCEQPLLPEPGVVSYRTGCAFIALSSVQRAKLKNFLQQLRSGLLNAG